MLKLLIFFNLFMVVYMQNGTEIDKNRGQEIDRKRAFMNKFAVFPILTHLHRMRPPYTTAWMDYCDPYHCNDYDKEVCGLNRRNMMFKYFRSGCHLILNNQCSAFRGTLKYDLIELKFCRTYVMHLRMSCPTNCELFEIKPICAMNSIKGNYVIFSNECALEMANCKNKMAGVKEYEAVKMKICESLLLQELNS